MFPNVTGKNPNVTGSCIHKLEPPLGTFSISNCFVKAICSRLNSTEEESDHFNCELDSHADTVCAGKEFVMFEKPNRYVEVSPF